MWPRRPRVLLPLGHVLGPRAPRPGGANHRGLKEAGAPWLAAAPLVLPHALTRCFSMQVELPPLVRLLGLPVRFRRHWMPRGTSSLRLTIHLLELLKNLSKYIAEATYAAGATGEIPGTGPP